MHSYDVALVFIIFIRQNAIAKRSTGTLETNENWHYLERFCFFSEIGTLHYKINYPRSYEVQKLYLYYDTASQWSAVYKSNLTCEERENTLDPRNNQIVPLTAADITSQVCTFMTRGDDDWVECVGDRRFISQRARWWYLAIGNCNSSKGLMLEYELMLTNGEPNQGLMFHFSADELLILPVDLLFLALQIVVLLVGVTVAIVLRSRHLYHQTYKLFLAAIIVEVLSRCIMCYAYYKYAQNGEGKPNAKLLAQLLRAANTVIYLVLLLLLAKGYTITRGRLSRSSSCKLTMLTSAFTSTYLALFTWQKQSFDPALVTYIYESPSGYCIAGLRLLSWFWYCTSTFMTVKRYPAKRGFYVRFSLFITLWFWMGPISVCVANFLLDPWVREEVVNMVDNAVVFYGFVVFLILTRPSAANRNFPFHVRTTQIDCINFPQNTYEVQYSTNQETAFALSGRTNNNGFVVNDYRMQDDNNVNSNGTTK